ncbi:hypothetical protein LRP52_07000 [Photobacterium sp. ZSDE20]|uniref:Uncharacterized protein n=1 Tax=Photobacterium pectinilyticum TaxID=2906793 RepID=A0ABT1N0L0_9GAMM|nr:hypothetical protein [Photobacterium sp. ZSDE20]MCQ1057657.1 hypothetical protein [Photobacterium sp. ZSDE20]MDD1821937.1 hypothetical protein [Photobacterium sp. ZSDE20]
MLGWFGGDGLEGTGQWMVFVGLEPGYLMAGGYEFSLALLAMSISFKHPATEWRVSIGNARH